MVCDAITLPMLLRSKDRSCMPGPGTDQSVQVNNYGILVMVGMINHVRAVVDMHLWPKYVPPSGTTRSKEHILTSSVSYVSIHKEWLR